MKYRFKLTNRVQALSINFLFLDSGRFERPPLYDGRYDVYCHELRSGRRPIRGRPCDLQGSHPKETGGGLPEPFNCESHFDDLYSIFQREAESDNQKDDGYHNAQVITAVGRGRTANSHDKSDRISTCDKEKENPPERAEYGARGSSKESESQAGHKTS